jgi:hypothetical protein
LRAQIIRSGSNGNDIYFEESVTERPTAGMRLYDFRTADGRLFWRVGTDATLHRFSDTRAMFIRPTGITHIVVTTATDSDKGMDADFTCDNVVATDSHNQFVWACTSTRQVLVWHGEDTPPATFKLVDVPVGIITIRPGSEAIVMVRRGDTVGLVHLEYNPRERKIVVEEDVHTTPSCIMLSPVMHGVGSMAVVLKHGGQRVLMVVAVHPTTGSYAWAERDIPMFFDLPGNCASPPDMSGGRPDTARQYAIASTDMKSVHSAKGGIEVYFMATGHLYGTLR